jgi:dipeptidyl aminopeptidase/acylaminoacyl peptidase
MKIKCLSGVRSRDRAAATAVVRALSLALAGIAVLESASLAQDSSRLARLFLEVSLSPDARYVATIEGDTSAAGGDPVVRELIIRSSTGRSSVTVALPCGRTKGCWPASPAWTPDSRHLSFALRDPDTHARSLYQVNADGSGVRRLLAFNGTIQTLRYSADGTLAMLAVASAAREPGATEAGATVNDLDSPALEQRIAVLEQNQLHWVSPADLFVYEYDWTPDGRGLVGTAAPGDGDRNWWVASLYAFDREDRPPRLLYAPASRQQQLAMPRVSPDGKRVAFIAGLMSDFGVIGGEIYTVPWSGGGAAAVTPQLAASVSAIRWSCHGQLQATVLAGAQSQLLEFPSGAGTAGTLLWQGQEFIAPVRAYSAAHCPSSTVALAHQSFNQPPEIEIGSIGKWHDLTHANAGLATGFRVRSLQWDSGPFQVQGWLVLPDTDPDPAAPQALPPLVTIVHGGPAAASEPRFIGAGSAQSLLAHGYALFMPNPRGSFGKGEAFVTANVRDFGHGDLDDILAGVEAVSRLGLTDPHRVGVIGHSYGGFMTMWAVTQTDRFKAAVAGAGISNWQSYYGQNGIDEWMIPYFGASVYDDPAVYARSSPINFIRQVRTPTFSYVGAADIECPAPQTLEFAHALKTLGTPSATVIYPNEGHSIHDPEHLADLDARIIAWFDRYLK